MQIKDAVAVVTGGASGLGLATTKRLLDAGASVVVIDLQRATNCGKLGERVKFAAADVTDEAAVGQALDLAESLGPLRINVNCAGIGSAAKTLGKDGPFPLDWFTKTIRSTSSARSTCCGCPPSGSRRPNRSARSAASSSTPRRSRRSRARSARPPTRRPRAASSA